MKIITFIVVSVIVIVIILATLNFFFQPEAIKLVENLGWDRLKGFVSGPWWNSIPTLILALGIFLTLRQITETRKSTNAQIAMDLFQELRSDRALEILRAIYNRKENDPNKLDTIDQHNIEYILDRFEVLGILVDKGIVDYRLAMDSYGGASALRCWYRLHLYIKEIEKQRGQYKVNYKSYTQRCLKYFIERKFSVKLRTESENIDIISELQRPEFGLNSKGNKTT